MAAHRSLRFYPAGRGKKRRIVVARLVTGRREEREYPDTMFFAIGDILSDGAEVVELPYPNDIDEDLIATWTYEDEYDLID